MKIALTGNIGSGKSTALSIFESLGATVIETDKIARQLTQLGQPCLKKILEHFGSSYEQHDGTLNRKKLRHTISVDHDAKIQLEKILHPEIFKEINRLEKECSTPYLLIEIPLLTENNRVNFDRVLLINCPENLKVNRAAVRDQTSNTQIERLLQTQPANETLKKLSDDIIVNDGSLEQLINQLKPLHEFYNKLSK